MLEFIFNDEFQAEKTLTAYEALYWICEAVHASHGSLPRFSNVETQIWKCRSGLIF